MKILIWVVNFFIISIINLFVGYLIGFNAGSVAVYFGWYYSSKFLCKCWDKYKVARSAKKQGVSSFDIIKHELPQTMILGCEQRRAKESELRTYLKPYVKDKAISKAYFDIVLEHYLRPIRYSNKSVCKRQQVKEDKICFCRKCGEKLLDNSRFCRKCGLEISEVKEKTK